MGLKLFHPETVADKTRELISRMRTAQVLSATILFCLAILSPAPGFAQAHASGRLLVKPKSHIADDDLEQRFASRGAKSTRTLRRLGVRVVSVPESSANAVLAALRSDPDIEFAEPDFVAAAAFSPNDPRVVSGEAWHLGRIQAPAAWDFTVGNPNVIVAVLDSGVNASNPDLAGRVLPGFDFVNNDADVSDDYGHGTAVTGTIVGAANNSLGSVGVAFGCRVLPVKVMDSMGFAYYSTIAEGIRFAVDHGARVINISIAGDAQSATLQSAIDYAWSSNVVVVAAAGNNANSVPQYPAACEHVVGVTATDANDQLASFSSFGGHLKLSAPGDNIWTTQRSADNYFGSWRGTSFASPIVAGVAALVASAKPGLANSEIISALEQSADDLGPAGFDNAFAYGRVNAYRAMLAVGATYNPFTPSPGTPPTVSISSPTAATQIPFGQELEISAQAAAGSSASQVSMVQFFANNSPLVGLSAAPFEFSWTPGQPGDYALTAVVTDEAGVRATSAPVLVRVAAPQTTATMHMEVSGVGTISPNLDGRALQLGKTYTVTAKPGRDQLFAGWEGINSTSASLTFVMREGLSLKAKFVPSPFVNLRGAFNGLVFNPDGIAPESSGAFTLTLTRLGTFSGRLHIGGGSYGFRGQFDLNGRANVVVQRPYQNPVALALTLDLAGGGTEISGSVSSGGWAAKLSADRNVFSALNNPAPQAGNVNFVLQRAAQNPDAVANGLSRIAINGATKVKGALLDGRKFSRASTLARNGDYPFYLSLSGGTEVVIGWVNFPSASIAAANGTVVWARTGTNAFATTLQATAVR